MPSITFKDIVSNCCERVDPSDEGNVPYIGLEHIGADSFTVPVLGNSQEVKGQKFKMKKGDVLFGRRRAYQKKVAIAPCDGIFSAHGMIFRPKPTIIQDLLPFFIRSDAFMNKAISLSVGSLSPTLNWGAIKDVRFSIPELKSQTPIAELLWAIEEDIELISQQIYQMDLLVKSRFIEMFENNVDSKNWSIHTMAQVCEVVTDGSHFSPEDVKEGYPMLSVKDMGAYGFDYSNCKHISQTDYDFLVKNGCKPLSGDVLIAKDGSFFKKGFVIKEEMDQAILSSIAIMRPKKNLMNPNYLVKFLLSDKVLATVSSMTSGTALKRVILKKFKSMKIVVPPIELQNQFALFVEQVDKSKVAISVL